MDPTITFKAELWLYPGMAGNWHFLSLPKRDASRLKKIYGSLARGWGSLRVEVSIGATKWKTSIFPDKKRGTYILPIKASVKKNEGLKEGDNIPVTLAIIT